MNKRAEKHLEIALGGDMNISTLKPLALIEIMTDFAKKEVEAINYTRCCESDSEQLLCKHCDNKKVLHSEATGLCPDRFKHFEAK
jgi:hypothetical protein